MEHHILGTNAGKQLSSVVSKCYGWIKCPMMTNTLAYYSSALITDVKELLPDSTLNVSSKPCPQILG
jgi:hypothetical protein